MSLYSENPALDFANTAATLAARIVRAGDAQAYSYLGPGITGVCLIDGPSTGGAYSAFDVTVAPGAGVPPHIHTKEDETFYVLEGTCALQCGDALLTLTSGMSAYGPRHIPHAFCNVGTTTARLVVVTTPGGFEGFFAEMEAGKAIYGDLSTVPSQMQFGELMGKWGMTPAFDAPEPVRVENPAPTQLDLGNHLMTLLVTAEQTGDQLLLTHVSVDPQGGPPPHVHHAEEEAFYLLDGRMEVMIGDYLTEVGPGDFVYGPRTVPHCWRNLGDTPTTLLMLVTPGASFQKFACEMAQFIQDSGGTPLSELRDPALLQRMGALFQNHQIAPAAPAIK